MWINQFTNPNIAIKRIHLLQGKLIVIDLQTERRNEMQ